MKDYRYTGPLSVSTLYVREDGKRVPLKVRFVPDGFVRLPEDHPITRSLVARGRLSLVEAESPEPSVEVEGSSPTPRHRNRKPPAAPPEGATETTPEENPQ